MYDDCNNLYSTSFMNYFLENYVHALRMLQFMYKCLTSNFQENKLNHFIKK